jgi:hypothetical protein
MRATKLFARGVLIAPQRANGIESTTGSATRAVSSSVPSARMRATKPFASSRNRRRRWSAPVR